MNKRTVKNQSIFELFVGIIIIFLLNIIFSNAYTRIDLTSEKRYTLSEPTKELLENLEDVVYVKVYLEGEFPSGFQRLRNAVQDMLDEFRTYANENIEYEFINPSEEKDEKDRNAIYKQLVEKGLQPTNLHFRDDAGSSEKLIFPGAIFSYLGKEAPLTFLQSQFGTGSEKVLNNSIESLEFEIAKTIQKLTLRRQFKIAFTEGHGELDEMQVADITKVLSESYLVERLDLTKCLPDKVNEYHAIIIAKPELSFDEKEKFKIDQYVMHGGKVLWFIENLFADMDSLTNKAECFTDQRNLNLEDQLFKYGIRINNDLIQDIECAPIPFVTGYSGNQPQQMLIPWYYYPLITPQSNHPVVKNIEVLRCQFVNTIDTIKSAKNIQKTILLTSSAYSKVLNHPIRIHLDMVKHEPKIEQFNKKNKSLAVLLEGSFESVFKNRLTNETFQMLDTLHIKFKDKSPKTKMLVVSDGDIIRNDVRKSNNVILPLGYDKYTNKTFGNKTFVLNAIDYLCDKSGLIIVRSKEVKLRLLNKVRVNNEKFYWQTVNMCFPIFSVVLFGIIYNFFRRRKYSGA